MCKTIRRVESLTPLHYRTALATRHLGDDRWLTHCVTGLRITQSDHATTNGFRGWALA